jgi:hypothetical protein
MHVHLVLLRVDGDGSDAQLATGAEDSNGNFAAICHQNRPDWFVLDLSGEKRCCGQLFLDFQLVELTFVEYLFLLMQNILIFGACRSARIPTPALMHIDILVDL